MSDSLEKIGAHEVAAWLRRHPGFLKQFPDLALTLVVPRDDGPTASLASYQLEVLRDKNRELSRRLAELIEQISGATLREANMANEVADNIQHIFAVTEQTGEGTRSTAAQVRELSKVAEELRQSVARFRIA